MLVTYALKYLRCFRPPLNMVAFGFLTPEPEHRASKLLKGSQVNTIYNDVRSNRGVP